MAKAEPKSASEIRYKSRKVRGGTSEGSRYRAKRLKDAAKKGEVPTRKGYTKIGKNPSVAKEVAKQVAKEAAGAAVGGAAGKAVIGATRAVRAVRAANKAKAAAKVGRARARARAVNEKTALSKYGRQGDPERPKSLASTRARRAGVNEPQRKEAVLGKVVEAIKKKNASRRPTQQKFDYRSDVEKYGQVKPKNLREKHDKEFFVKQRSKLDQDFETIKPRTENYKIERRAADRIIPVPIAKRKGEKMEKPKGASRRSISGSSERRPTMTRKSKMSATTFGALSKKRKREKLKDLK